MKFNLNPKAKTNSKDASSSPSNPADAVVNIKTKKATHPKPPVKNYWRIISFGNRIDHATMLIATGTAASSGVALPLMNIVFGNLVGNFNGYFVPGSTVTKHDFEKSVSRQALYIVYLFIGKFILTYVAMFSFRTAGLRVSAAMRLEFMKSLVAQPVSTLDKVSAGTISDTITSSASTIQLSISEKLSSMFQAFALLIAAYAIAFRYSWALTLVASSALLFIVIIYSFLTPAVLKAQQAIDKANEKHASVAAEIFGSIRTVFCLNAENQLSQKYFSWVEETQSRGLRYAPLVGTQISPVFFSMYASFALSFWYGTKSFQEGRIENVSTVVIVFFSVLIVTSVMGNIVQPLMMITKAISASVTFFKMIDSETVKADGLRAPAVSAKEDVELNNVSFAYPSRHGVQVLDEFSAKFAKGKTTALVGPSGAGKSTIVALLERWYELDERADAAVSLPKSDLKDAIQSEAKEVDETDSMRAMNRGTITCGGKNIHTFDLKWWRTQIGLVQQEPFLFNDTIFNNVAFGLLGTAWENESAAKKLELVKEACNEAYADEFIDKLSSGYDTVVGESGIKLSGGQRQRIAIARSIVRRPTILILDEATSSIDVRSEKVVQAALDRASLSRTTIVIAHRLATIRKADHIIVLQNGSKTEEGVHDELLAKEDGLYAGLVRAQKIEEDANAETTVFGESEVGLQTQPSAEDASVSPREEREEASPYKRKNFLTAIGTFLYGQHTHWPLFLIAMIAIMGCGAAYSLQSWFFAQLIQVFTFTGHKLTNSRNFWALMFFILALAMAVCYYVVGHSVSAISAYVGASSRKDYFTNIIRRSVPYFDQEDNASGAIMARLSTDPKQLSEVLGLQGALPLISVWNMIGCISIAFSFGWKLTLVVFFSAMPVLLVSAFTRMRYDVYFEVINSKVFAASSQFATEAISAFRTVSSLTMEDTIIEKYSKMLKDQIHASVRTASYATLIFAMCDSVELLCMALAFWYGGQLLADRSYNLLQFFVIYVAIVQGSQGAGQFFSIAPNLAQATQSANRILSMRDHGSKPMKFEEEGPDEKTSSNANVPLTPASSNQGAQVELHNVSFHYSTRTSPVFLNVSLTIHPGQFVAFVGPSGCGKTTIISLLERFYEPQSGTITCDGRDITRTDLGGYRKGIALVAQEPKLFEGTVKENLLLGLGKETSDVEMQQACRDAQIHDFITSLPEGYDTGLGQNTSTELSGGQKQRLCLARALLRKPRLLLLDEATSSLDSQSERLVQEAIERLVGKDHADGAHEQQDQMEGRDEAHDEAGVGSGSGSRSSGMTVIAVAHRLATIQKADVIFVFGESEVGKGAKIVERGSHHELMARRGVYWQMGRGQALER